MTPGNSQAVASGTVDLGGGIGEGFWNMVGDVIARIANRALLLRVVAD